MDSTEVPDAWSRLRRQSWAATTVVPDVAEDLRSRSIHLSQVPGTMSVVAITTMGTWCCRVEWIVVCADAHGVIEDPAELAKITEWAKKQEQEPLLSVCARTPPEPALAP